MSDVLAYGVVNESLVFYRNKVYVIAVVIVCVVCVCICHDCRCF